MVLVATTRRLAEQFIQTGFHLDNCGDGRRIAAQEIADGAGADTRGRRQLALADPVVDDALSESHEGVGYFAHDDADYGRAIGRSTTIRNVVRAEIRPPHYDGDMSAGIYPEPTTPLMRWAQRVIAAVESATHAAKLCGVPKSNLEGWAKGIGISSRNQQRVCDATGFSMAVLMEDEPLPQSWLDQHAGTGRRRGRPKRPKLVTIEGEPVSIEQSWRDAMEALNKELRDLREENARLKFVIDALRAKPRQH